MTSPLKLTIELVPSTSWYNNLRTLMGKKHWDILRKKVYADFGYCCGICKTRSKLHCHEIWKYDDQNHVQTLTGFIALCSLCHHVKHLGFAQILANRGELNFDKLIDHFLKVNNCTKEIFEKHKNDSFKIWEQRSKHQWQINIGKHHLLS